jgi:hypothetical protein
MRSSLRRYRLGWRRACRAHGLDREETMKVVDDYKKAIEHGDEALLKEVFAPQVRFDPPSGESSLRPADLASHVMSQVVRVAPRIKNVLTADAGSNSYLLTFEAEIEGEKLQVVDQLHLDEHERIDHLTIYMRPIAAAQKFGAAIRQRLQPALKRNKLGGGEV